MPPISSFHTVTIHNFANPARMSEVVFVQSKIRPGADLSPAVFRKWYEEVHIRDLLNTPGVGTVFRYVNTTATDEAQFPGFPYLAVYPGVSREWLLSDTCEFLKVPLHSDLLPGPKGFVFDVADFVIGAYQEVGSIEDGVFSGEIALGIEYAGCSTAMDAHTNRTPKARCRRTYRRSSSRE